MIRSCSYTKDRTGVVKAEEAAGQQNYKTTDLNDQTWQIKQPKTNGLMKLSLFTSFSTPAMLEINIIINLLVPMLISRSSVHAIIKKKTR